MDSLYLLIPVALIFCAIAIKLLIWAIDSGQYDDLDKDAWRILADPPTQQNSPVAQTPDSAQPGERASSAPSEQPTSATTGCPQTDSGEKQQ